jgi:sulfite reductase alpha subunit-like flavoprotein
LQQLGIEYLLPMGLGDDQARYGYMTQWNSWRKTLLQKMQEYGCVSNAVHLGNSGSATAPLYDVGVSTSSSGQGNDVQSVFPAPLCSVLRSPLRSTVICNKRLTRESWAQDIRNVVLQFDNHNLVAADGSVISEFRYKAGDVATVHPKNDPTVVTRALALVRLPNAIVASLDMTLDVQLTDSSAGRRPSLLPPGSYTLGILLTCYRTCCLFI